MQELANRIGLGWIYEHPKEVFAEMATAMPSFANITWDRLEREDAITNPCTAPNRPGEEIIFGDGFPTASGRGKIVPADLTPPDELPDEAYPWVLTTGRLLEHWHTGSMTRRASRLDDLEPEAIACLNKRALTSLGIAAGQSVKVTTSRGEITLKARQDRDVPAGMVFIPF